MKTMKYTIWTRYEHWTKNGKEFTSWFLRYRNSFFDTEKDAIIEMKRQKTFSIPTDKVVKLNKTRAKLYLMGGIVPYVLLNDRTGRRHESLDLLCDKKDVEQLRELFRKEDLYDPKRDSLTYTVNNIDYGFQVVIDKIKVNIFVFEETDKGITEYTFNCKKKIGRIKSIAAKMNDYIMPYVT